MDNEPEFDEEYWGSIIEEVRLLEQPTEFAIKEESKWDNLDEKSKFFEIERYKEDTQHRRTLSTWAGVVVSMWLLCVVLILIGNTRNYRLSDSVLITLLGTTTLNVLALMLVVLNDIFRNGKKD